MARYQPTRAQIRRVLIQALILRDGNHCKICGIDGEKTQLIIEHRDGDPSNYDINNLELTCLSCNQRKRPDFVQTVSVTTGIFERENTNGQVVDSETEKNRQRERLRKSPIEIQINRDGEPKFRRYLWKNIGRPGGLLKQDAIDEGAAIAGVNVQTVERWLRPAVSEAGPFRIPIEKEKEIIVLRSDYNPPDTPLGRLDLQLMRERQEQELAERESQVMEKEVATKIANTFKRDAHDYLAILKSVGLSDAEINSKIRELRGGNGHNKEGGSLCK